MNGQTSISFEYGQIAANNMMINRRPGDNYEAALKKYNDMPKPKGHKIFLCYNRRDRRFWVCDLFSREFLEWRGVTIVNT